MSILLLFLGLLPIMLLPDAFGGGSDDDDGNGMGDGDLIIQPDTDDDTPPIAPVDVDPDTVLQPDEDDDTPDAFGGPVTGPVLSPDESADAPFNTDGDGTLLQQLLGENSDATAGIGHLGAVITDTEDTELGNSNDLFSLDSDDIDANGEGMLGFRDGVPIIETDGPVNVVDGGDGDDTITTGDEAAYVFGGEGRDTVTVGDGVAAVFGGLGDDTIHGSDASHADGAVSAYLNGGEGNDVINGGAGDEVILGGEHSEDNASSDAASDDWLSGGGGDDIIRGGFGSDILSGGDGDDIIDHLGRSEELLGEERREFSWHIDNDADQLDGGDGNDTLIFDRADTATGGEGNDTFWLYHDSSSGVGHAEITDFTPGEDFLRISLNPDVASGTPEVTVLPSDDGLDSIVSVNGEVIAILQGTISASAADIYVDIPQNIFG